MIIEAGVMNFWAMVGALLAAGFSGTLLLIKIIEFLRERYF